MYWEQRRFPIDPAGAWFGAAARNRSDQDALRSAHASGAGFRNTWLCYDTGTPTDAHPAAQS
jgi:hypothetical protein